LHISMLYIHVALPIYYTFALFLRLSAGVVKLVDTLDLGSNAERLGGSSPFTRTFFANPRFQMLTIKEVSLAHPPAQQPAFLTARSEERRVGNEYSRQR